MVPPIFRSLNRPLAILGAERKLFFFALPMGAGVSNLLRMFFSEILMFLLLFALAGGGHQERSANVQVSIIFGENANTLRPHEVCTSPGVEAAACLGWIAHHHTATTDGKDVVREFRHEWRMADKDDLVESADGMTIDWVQLPPTLLYWLATLIVNEVKGVNRVVFDITSKPPGAIEWE